MRPRDSADTTRYTGAARQDPAGARMPRATQGLGWTLGLRTVSQECGFLAPRPTEKQDEGRPRGSTDTAYPTPWPPKPGPLSITPNPQRATSRWGFPATSPAWGTSQGGWVGLKDFAP